MKLSVNSIIVSTVENIDIAFQLEDIRYSFLSGLLSANSRYKFGYYAYKVSDLNDVYDAIMTSYPYHNTYRQETTYESCNSIENLQIAS